MAWQLHPFFLRGLRADRNARGVPWRRGLGSAFLYFSRNVACTETDEASQGTDGWHGGFNSCFPLDLALADTYCSY